MGKDDIKKWVDDSKKGKNYVKVLNYCCEPKVFDTRLWESDMKLSMQDMGEIVKNMMLAGGMVFNDGKWKTTKIAQELIKDIS